MSMEQRSLCRCTQLLQWFFLAQVIKLLTIALVFKDVSGPCWFIYRHTFRRLTWVMTWHFSLKNLLCQPRQTLRWQYNAVPMWSCQVSSIHVELCITSDLNNRFEVFYGQWVWFRWWLTEYIDSIFFWFDPRIFNKISFIFLHTSQHLHQVIL